MKKNISINLQGMIFHIEEDGYEVLKQYLDSIKNYFSTYAGHQEIIADIESRMAEIFYANLTPTKQVITLEDVEVLIKKMGSVNDFAQIEEDEEAPKATVYGNMASDSVGTEPKRLSRDGNRKVIAGVASGLAYYFNTDPMWIRLFLVALVLIAPATAGISAGFIIIAYILCWIALPVSYDIPGTYSAGTTTSRKLYRNPDNKNLGGVCSGLALYFGIDTAIVRLIFLVTFFVFGSGLFLYLLLWLILPEAKTPTEKAQMQGKPLTLSGIENSLKSSLQPDGAQQENTLTKLILLPVRLVSQILVVLSRILGPVISALLVVVRIFAGILLLIIALAGIVTLVTLMGVSLGAIQEANFIHLDNMPANFFFSDFPTIGKITAFITGLIPCVFLIILGVALLSKQFFIRATVGWSMFAVFLISGFVFLITLMSYHKNFEEDGVYVAERTFPASGFQTVSLDANKIRGGFSGDFNIEIESNAGNDILLIQEFGAEGRSEEDAIKNARMMAYRVVQKDSSLTLDNGYTFKPNAVFRDQNLNLKLRLPENKKFRISEDLARLLPSSAFDANYSNEQIGRNTWKIKNNIFSCLTCTAADSAELNERNDIGIDHDDEFSTDFLKNASEFGSDSQILNVTNFRKISVVGPFYVKIIKDAGFGVKAWGEAEDLNKMKYEVEDGELKIYPRKSGFSLGNDMNPIYISIQMPNLQEVSLVGASTGEIADFKADRLKITQTGATRCFLRTTSRRLNLDLTGASVAVVQGTTDVMEANVVGACKLKAGKLRVETAELDVTGGSAADVFVTRELKADVNGGSDLTYKGNPELTEIDHNGGGQVNHAGEEQE
jgi:phage shock protein PspC (stress-responsive transcriptional regulator)